MTRFFEISKVSLLVDFWKNALINPRSKTGNFGRGVCKANTALSFTLRLTVRAQIFFDFVFYESLRIPLTCLHDISYAFGVVGRGRM